VHVCRPSPRRRPTLPEFLYCRVKCIGDVVQLDRLVLEQCLVEPLRHPRPIDIVHRPAATSQSVKTYPLVACHLPHRADDAAEAAEQHRGSEVHGLVRLLSVSLSRLARAQERQHRLWQIEIHQSRDGKSAVMESEARLERVLMLMAMAGEVKDVS
jgi:hypothetical protein